MPTWRTWFLQEYARYWYGLGVLLLVVFAVAELARLGAPLGGFQILGLVLLSIGVLATGVAGYLIIWRRDSEATRWMLRGLSRLKPGGQNRPP